jgi:hypothetical protein
MNIIYIANEYLLAGVLNVEHLLRHFKADAAAAALNYFDMF